MANKFNINKEKRQQMIRSIQTYFSTELDEDLGDLAASFLLDFIIENLGPEFYNQGIYDSYAYILDKTEDLLSLQKILR